MTSLPASALKRIPIVLWLLLILVAAAVAGTKSSDQWVRVEKTIDGDTLRLEDGRPVRLIGIDAPEIDHRESKAEPWAMESWQALGRLSNGQKVRLEFGADRHDSHGRVLAYVYDQNGLLINQRMIDLGLAHVLYVAPNTDIFERLLSAQRKAMAAGKGIWKNFTRDKQKAIGNINSKRFHQPGCQLARKIRPHNRIIFQNRWDAFYQGFAPCRRCIVIPKKELKHS